jgi:hypothetical protein
LWQCFFRFWRSSSSNCWFCLNWLPSLVLWLQSFNIFNLIFGGKFIILADNCLSLISNWLSII